MHRLFKRKEKDIIYHDRIGSYLIAFYNQQLCLIKTPNGLYLLGGANQDDESNLDCIKREAMEETGFEVEINQFVCSAESYEWMESKGYIHHVQYYYFGKVIKKIKEQTEQDHELVFLDADACNMKVEMQKWAIEMACSMHK